MRVLKSRLFGDAAPDIEETILQDAYPALKDRASGDVVSPDGIAGSFAG
jgi:hypothetical protein